MKFVNKGKDRIKVRIGKRFNFGWVTVRPGETIDLPKDKGKKFGLEKASNQELPEVTGGKIGDKKVETKQFDSDYKRKLVKIKGISSKRAKDIIKVFPTEKKLKHAISHDDELPFRDDVEEKLRKEYGK